MANIPNDLEMFLARGKQLAIDPRTSPIGAVKLKSLDEVEETTLELFPTSQVLDDPYENLPGFYHVPVVDLVSESEMYDPEGMLCWIGVLGCYASVDPEHGTVNKFPKVTWKHIVAKPLNYLDAPWRFPEVQRWRNFPFVINETGQRLEPYIEVCDLHQDRLSNKLPLSSDLLPVFRLAYLEDWLRGVANQFPFAGVQVAPRASLGCRKCYEAQEMWLKETIAAVPILEASPNRAGYIQCPGCGRSFSISHDRVFRDQIHLQCGQKIRVIASP